MSRRTFVALALVALTTLAGCSALPVSDANAGGNGAVTVYLSDRPGVTDQFDAVNVTVTKVALKRADEGCRGCHGDANDSAWIVRDIPDATVDLTEYAGANATALVRDAGVPNGTYEAVSVRVGDVTAVKNGSRVTVRVPHDRLRVHEEFTVTPGKSVGFVVDAAVHETEGGYVLRPVVNESGTDVRVCTRDGNHGDGAGRNGSDSGCDCRCGG
ncbi:DUF4382 domain-containing protein [Halarchaeum sp. P4]|uniref:DUF4382 domain-containing protein n=1 Tax=Halarchaeum sp. P4 TaxID=3421639 RepID=UPI003EB8A092